jgi:hypothetical protein
MLSLMSPLSGVRVRRVVAGALSCMVVAATAGAQPPADVSKEKSFFTAFDAETLAALPLGENVYAILETTQSEVIADRFNSGGLNVGEGVRAAGFLGSWSQTRYRIGEIDITDPSGRGGALLFPELLPWSRVSIGTGMFGADTIAPGLAIDLEVRDAAARWTSTVQASGSGGSLASPSPNLTLAPPIARLRSWAHGSGFFSGTTSGGLGVVGGAALTTADKYIRDEQVARTAHVGSAFVNVVAQPSGGSRLRLFGWAQSATRKAPGEGTTSAFSVVPGSDVAGHVQASLETTRPTGAVWKGAAGYTQQNHENGLVPFASALDRVASGPLPALLSTVSDHTIRRVQFTGRTTSAAASRHRAALGFDVDYSAMRSSGFFNGTVGERIQDSPARAFRFNRADADSQRRRTTVALFASDHLTLSPALTVDGSVRIEAVRGSARGAADGITWVSALPRVAFRWKVTDLARLSLVAGYRRAANQLNLDLLAWGDPGAPTVGTYRWNGDFDGAGATLGTFTDRLGPGTGGDAAFSRIDPDLKRPYTDEFVVGVESDRDGWLKWGLMGVGRYETNLINVVDTGVPISAYALGSQFDPGQVLDSPFDDQQLAAYNRLPSTFGHNRYLLTNPDVEAARSFALKLTAQANGERFTSLWVATASLAQGSAGNRGFGPLENDQDVIGELHTNPNAAGFARGRLFADRAFTIKWTTVYKLPGDLDVGAIARYQDGQPMSRLVVATSLNQGDEILLAYPNASHRFTFTGTLDLRVRKGLPIGSTKADLIFDAYNLITRSNEVEEDPFTGPGFRRSTAIEPLPAVHLGVRVTF